MTKETDRLIEEFVRSNPKEARKFIKNCVDLYLKSLEEEEKNVKKR
jgi:hypothetical protein